ncbi:BREX-2 system phosphatase PglZ [Streptomyces sp. STR69]|uniref:BREX-2 system phosphatase PglZ n=1 Tax=Streptomyces sp. STR69 TaxID=1796942 RepID=UPI0021CABCD8|nr:BREX-2 system phosphatase PglZ [Streptomyces sp. STR69]
MDRALARLWVGDGEAEPALALAYRTLHDAARRRRATLDEAFVARLGPWVKRATAAQPGRALPIEDVLRSVALPLAKVRPPVMMVLDGMTSAVGAQLGGELTVTGRWSELSGAGQRAAAVAMVPSVTAISRATLLCGRPVSGGQDEEKEGFAAFWEQHRHTAVLFHKNEIPGPAGQLLDSRLVAAVASDDVVAVVLITIGENLDHGQRSSLADWSVSQVKYLAELLNAARGQGRPVVVVSGHGHVLDRAEAGCELSAAEGVESAHWRTWTEVGEGEVALSGPQVLENGGRVTVPWSEGDPLHPAQGRISRRCRTRRDGGTCTGPGPVGGAGTPGVARAATRVRTAGVVGRGSRVHDGARPCQAGEEGDEGQAEATAAGRRVFADDAIEAPVAAPPVEPAALTLGMRILDTTIYKHQRKFVRKAPEHKVVAAVIDALARSHSRRSLPPPSARAAVRTPVPKAW